MAKQQAPKSFSSELKAWLDGKQAKNLDTLIESFGEKSFAVIMLLFMLLPALPGPTAAHPLEAVVILVAAQQFLGLKSLWLPKFLTSRIHLDRLARSKVMARVLRMVEWLEAKSSPRGKWLFGLPLMNRLIALIIIGFTLTAFFAPPFSLLDTLPAIGVVLLSLSLLLDDAVMLIVGLIIGLLGVGLFLFLGQEIANYMKHHIFHKQ